jgi:murein DD-endopeptidase MepM/ murein hydrolase activator NlpD
MRSVLTVLALWASSLASAAEPLAIRFYPDRIYPYPLESSRGLQSVLVHNVAVVNVGTAPTMVESVEIQVESAGAVLASERLAGPAVARAAATGAAMEKGGMLKLLAFQFRPDLLLADGTSLAETPTLAPRSALLVASRFLAFRGKADAVRVRVSGRGVDGQLIEAQATVPVVGFESKVRYGYPLSGTSFVGAGATPHTGHRWAIPEQFGLDIVKIGEGGLTHRGDGAKRADYFINGTDVLASADGTVRAAVDAVAESDDSLRQPGEGAEKYMTRVIAGQGERLMAGTTAVFGNHVIVEHAPGEFTAYGHLQAGSVRVREGDTVKRGQLIAKVGHSGNSTEPHLHFQLMDTAAPLLAVGLPIVFENVELPFADGPRAIQSGDIVVVR